MKRSAFVVASAAGALMLIFSAGMVGAWACTPQPRSFAIAPAAAGAGSIATVVGQGVPAGSPVHVRWDGLKGEIIGSATADERGQFHASVTIPPARPGVHAVIFSAGPVTEPSVAGIGRLPFRLSPGDGQPASLPVLDPWAPETGTRSPAGHATADRDLAAGLGALGVGLATLAGGTALAVVGRRHRGRAGAQS